jgi:arylformamidase
MTWREYSETELEREYTPASRVANIQIYLDDYATRGDHARQTISHQQIKYGEHPDEWLWHAPIDLPKTESRKIFVFVHGGFWRRLSANDGTFLTPAWCNLGYDTASINYSLCPSESLEVLVEQTKRAIQFLTTRYKPGEMLLVGHSAGAHLVAMNLCTENEIKYAGALLISGIYDLEPILHTSINNDIKLNESTANNLSPIKQLVRNTTLKVKNNTPVAIVWGENETDEFKRQSTEFATAWSASNPGSPSRTKEIASRNHFDVLDDLAKRDVIDLLGAQKP